MEAIGLKSKGQNERVIGNALAAAPGARWDANTNGNRRSLNVNEHARVWRSEVSVQYRRAPLARRLPARLVCGLGPSLAGHAGCQAQPAWLHSQLGQWMTEAEREMNGDRQGEREREREERRNMFRMEKEAEARDGVKEGGGGGGLEHRRGVEC
ncbi:hypothetical protein EYF80_050808 [Liparis tanakae]|uniref:Uncharacterized protein n=1 Tax=Liparis tanakae TaxID=230148 RepID=A0A4Z2FE24_9TELE|nr:hypothetical protein EYF80_050808 [Liparis tanakae]